MKRHLRIVVLGIVLLALAFALVLLLGRGKDARVRRFSREAEILEKNGDYENAIIQLRKALQIEPAAREVHQQLGRVYSRARSVEAGLRHQEPPRVPRTPAGKEGRFLETDMDNRDGRGGADARQDCEAEPPGASPSD